MFSDSRIYLQPTSISGTDVNQTNETSSYSYAQNGLTNKLLQRRAKITELNSGINIALKVNGFRFLLSCSAINNTDIKLLSPRF